MEDFNLVEVLMNAQYNLESLARQNPALKLHPSFVVAKSQIDNCVKYLEEKTEQD